MTLMFALARRASKALPPPIAVSGFAIRCRTSGAVANVIHSVEDATDLVRLETRGSERVRKAAAPAREAAAEYRRALLDYNKRPVALLELRPLRVGTADVVLLQRHRVSNAIAKHTLQ
jgi:hypothetical protein